MELVLSKALDVLATAAAEKTAEKLNRTEFVVRLLTAVGLKPDKPPSDFDGVYVYSLVQYGAEKPPEVLHLFREPEIREAFQKSFEKNDPSILETEADKFLEWNRIGDELRAKNIDVRREFAVFSAVFQEVVDASRDPAETRRDQHLASILERLNSLPDLTAIREELGLLHGASRARQFVLEPAGNKLKVFISSRMNELRDLRGILQEALQTHGFDAFLYESGSGARPDTIEEASLSQVEAADVYLGIFDKSYGEVTIDEFRHARGLNKPCLIYIRDQHARRESRLERFLNTEVLDVRKGLAPYYFDAATELAKRAAEDLQAWLVREYRIASARLVDESTSRQEQERLQKELERLRSLTRDTLPQGSALDLLGANLDVWFRVSGYAAEAHEIRTADTYERIINVPERERRFTRVLVMAVEGTAELPHLRNLGARAREQGVPEAWLVSALRKSPSVSQEIANQDATASPKLACYTFDDLIDLGADFSGYFEWLESEVEDRKIDKNYVPLACTKTELDPVTNESIGVSVFGEKEGWIDRYIDQWLDDPSKEHISVLGQFGTGKTWFALHYAWTALQRYREAQKRGVKRPRLPIYIALRDHAKAIDVRNLFSEFFFSKQNIEIRNYSVFEELNRMGRFLLIFDGFDEMADRVDRDKVIEHFWKLAQVVAPRSKVILTSRTEHFPNDQESRKLLSAELQASTGGLKMTSPQFEVLELKRLDEAQIRQLLTAQGLSKSAIDRIMKNNALSDLASRPVMIDLIINSLQEIERGDAIDVSRIYLYAIRRKMEQDITTGRTFTSLADKLYFLCELFWAMLSQKKMSLNYQEFPAEIARVFGPRLNGPGDRDNFKYDMMAQNMLIRKDGDYSPAHRSLLEFGVAYKLAAEMGILAEDFTAVARQQTGIDASSPAENRSWSRQFAASGAVRPVLGRFSAESTENLKKTLGARPITPAMLELMVPMLDGESAIEVLKTLIEQSVGDDDSAAGIIAGNALALLIGFSIDAVKGGSFAGAHFVELSLKNVDLSGADFSGAVFERCTLKEMRLSHTNLANTTWRHGVLEAKDFEEADLRNAKFSETDCGLASIFSKVTINANGLVLMVYRDQVEFWDLHSQKRTAVISQRRHGYLNFEDGALLASFMVMPEFLGKLQLWDLSNTAEPMNAPWPAALADKSFDQAIAVGDSNQLWLIGEESLILADLPSGTISTQHAASMSGTTSSAAAPDGVHVAIGGSTLDFWTSDGAYTYTPSDSEPNQQQFELLAFSPSGLYLAAMARRYHQDAERRFALYVVNTETKNVSTWNSPECESIAFASETLVLAATSSTLHLSDLTTGKQVTNAQFDRYAAYPKINPSATAVVYCDTSGNFHIVDARPFLAIHANSKPLFPGDPGVEIGSTWAEEADWPEWWRNADPRPAVPENHVPNPRFGQTVYSQVMDTRCRGLQLTGVSGLSDNLREAFIKRGAIYQPGAFEWFKKFVGR